jgi:hypothetical protein
LLQKSFWGGGRKFLEPLMSFTRGDVDPKAITDLRSGVEKRRSSKKSKDQLSGDFLGGPIFDFCNHYQGQSGPRPCAHRGPGNAPNAAIEPLAQRQPNML